MAAQKAAVSLLSGGEVKVRRYTEAAGDVQTMDPPGWAPDLGMGTVKRGVADAMM
jgi:hypothetical protein